MDLRGLREEQRLAQGIHEVYGRVHDELDLSGILPASRYRASPRVLRHFVMARIAEPASKRASVRLLEQGFGVQLPLRRSVG